MLRRTELAAPKSAEKAFLARENACITTDIANLYLYIPFYAGMEEEVYNDFYRSVKSRVYPLLREVIRDPFIDSDFLLEFLYETEEERHQSFLPESHTQKDTFHFLGRYFLPKGKQVLIDGEWRIALFDT